MSERKAMAMALVDVRCRHRNTASTQQVRHRMKSRAGPCRQRRSRRLCFASQTPHYVDFQAELELLKRLQQEQTMANLSGYNFAYLDEQTKRISAALS